MKKPDQTREDLFEKIAALEERLWEAEQTIEAIRKGEIDALVVEKPEGEQLYTLTGADHGYRVLVESINEGALILSSDDSIYYCNSSFSEMVKAPIEKIIGTGLEHHIDQRSICKVKELLREVRASGSAIDEFLLKRADGTTMPVNLSLRLVSLPTFQGLCAIVTDLTVRKRAEEELRMTADKLRRSNEDLQDFAFIASHDLQEPLRKIQSFSDLIIQNNLEMLDDKGRDYLRRMHGSAKRMQQFIRDLLKYSRVASRSEPTKVVDLNEVAAEAVADLEFSLEQQSGKVDIADLPAIEAEKAQVRQVFQNLIANSLKFRGEQNPRIRIYSRHNDNECRIFIEDNGIGFDEKYLGKIFLPFQRLHGRSEYEGTGMGLAICRKIVERHGGSITAKSKPGEGSVFIITLPIKQAGV